MLSLLPLVAIALLFWLLLIRPQQRRQKELGRMQASLKVGDEVMLTSGIYGVLREVDEEALHVQIADGVTVRVVRGAIGQVVQQPEPIEPGPEEN